MPRDKIIFLDFDGVLNIEHYQNLLHNQGKAWQDERCHLCRHRD